METFEEFEKYLQAGLKDLYSPTYQPPPLLWAVTGCNPQQGVESLQAAIIRAIEALKPAPDVPATAPVRRLYQVLVCRYIQGLTQMQTAQRLNITSRHLRREQQEAVHMLAQRLWEQRQAGLPRPTDRPPAALSPTGRCAESLSPIYSPLPDAAWRSQIKQELIALQQSAPGNVAGVSETIQSALKSIQALADKQGIRLIVNLPQPDLMVTLHTSVLREVLITTIEKLLPCLAGGEILIQAERSGESVKITVTGYPIITENPPQSDFIREVLGASGSSVKVSLADNSIQFLMVIPSADKITVAVVEDNADLVHFYYNYTTRTRYQIVHVPGERDAFAALVNLEPDIIILDLMLPNVDGWELLAQLHEHPGIRSVPIIVCSVVRRAELALAHGAALYVQKPVRRQEFIQALDQALALISTKGPKT
ncbi:MAG: response regulator [Chloroflexota bacterium]